MTHLPFVAGAYGVALLVIGSFAMAAKLRLSRAAARLRALDTRRETPR